MGSPLPTLIDSTTVLSSRPLQYIIFWAWRASRTWPSVLFDVDVRSIFGNGKVSVPTSIYRKPAGARGGGVMDLYVIISTMVHTLGRLIK